MQKANTVSPKKRRRTQASRHALMQTGSRGAYEGLLEITRNRIQWMEQEMNCSSKTGTGEDGGIEQRRGRLGIWVRGKEMLPNGGSGATGKGLPQRAITTKGALDLLIGEEIGRFGGRKKEIGGGGVRPPAALPASRFFSFFYH